MAHDHPDTVKGANRVSLKEAKKKHIRFGTCEEGFGKFDFNNPTAIDAWRNASEAYAKQVSGEVRAIISSNLRPTSIWNIVELPALKANPNVTIIIVIDPVTFVESIIFLR